MIKICQVCNETKDISQFHRHNKRKDGLRANCIECGRIMARDFYRKNPEPYKLRASKERKSKRDQRKQWFNSIRLQYGCRLCGESDVEVLDFHHFEPAEKSFGIVSETDLALEKLIPEINKCVVLCANCHRRVHAGTRTTNKSMLCDVKLHR
jgi:hypothetical protein